MRSGYKNTCICKNFCTFAAEQCIFFFLISPSKIHIEWEKGRLFNNKPQTNAKQFLVLLLLFNWRVNPILETTVTEALLLRRQKKTRFALFFHSNGLGLIFCAYIVTINWVNNGDFDYYSLLNIFSSTFSVYFSLFTPLLMKAKKKNKKPRFIFVLKLWTFNATWMFSLIYEGEAHIIHFCQILFKCKHLLFEFKYSTDFHAFNSVLT